MFLFFITCFHERKRNLKPFKCVAQNKTKMILLIFLFSTVLAQEINCIQKGGFCHPNFFCPNQLHFANDRGECGTSEIFVFSEHFIYIFFQKKISKALVVVLLTRDVDQLVIVNLCVQD